MDNVPTINFKPGEIVFKEGDLSNDIYLVISGKIEISRQRDKVKIVLATPGPNSIFGEMALIDGQPRSATAIALEYTYCYKCSASGIINELKKIDKDVYQTIQNFAAIIRENNNLKLRYNKDRAVLNSPFVIQDENIKKPYTKKEEILNNKPLQEKIEKLSPFIKSMYRVLMQIAYE